MLDDKSGYTQMTAIWLWNYCASKWMILALAFEVNSKIRVLLWMA